MNKRGGETRAIVRIVATRIHLQGEENPEWFVKWYRLESLRKCQISILVIHRYFLNL